MRLLPAGTVMLVAGIALSGCSSDTYPSSSKVSISATAREVASHIHGCSHITKTAQLMLGEDLSQVQLDKIRRSQSLVSCHYGDASLSIQAYKRLDDAKADFVSFQKLSSLHQYVLVGPRWRVQDWEVSTSIDEQKSLLSKVQKDLGGSLVEFTKH
jgi:hypothetical protein